MYTDTIIRNPFLTPCMRVAVGGTFDPVHDGHYALLKKAFELGDEGVVVGLTSDDLAPKTRDEERRIRPFEERKEDLVEAIEEVNEWNRDYEVDKLEDPFGIASEDPSFDCIVVSPETKKGAEKINGIRQENGMETLDIVVVPYIAAEDGNPISSTRVVKGEIDKHGNVKGEETQG